MMVVSRRVRQCQDEIMGRGEKVERTWATPPVSMSGGDTVHMIGESQCDPTVRT
jgi:hypothetical protein